MSGLAAGRTTPLRFAALLPLVFLAVPLLAQDAVDADYRVFDTVHVRGRGQPLKGTILSGAEPGSPKLKIRLESGIELEVDRDEVERILPRETPEKAFKSRAKRLSSGGSAEDHRRLAEWGYGLGLIVDAEGELRAALAAEQDATAKLGHRVRLVELLEERSAQLSGEERDAVFEQILAQGEAAGPSTPAIALAHARVALELTLPEVAVPLLQGARQTLEEKAKSVPPPDAGGPESGGGSGDGTGDGGDGGDGADGGDQDGGDGEDGPVRRFGRDGAPLPPDRRGQGDDAGGADVPAAEADDFSPQKLPGLEGKERLLYRDVLEALGRAHTQAGQPDPGADAYSKLLEIWPQDREATQGRARLLAGKGDTNQAIGIVSETLKVHPRDADLLLLRGQLHYLAKHDNPAQTDLLAAIKQAGEDAELLRRARVALGWVHIAAGRFKKAAPYVDKADADPGYGPARLAKGVIAEFFGDPRKGISLYEEAERLLEPSGGEAAYCRAFALAKLDDIETAERALRLAVQAGYEFRLAVRALVDMARKRGDVIEEGRLLELLYRATPAPDADLLAALGRAYLQQERRARARGIFERGLELEPGDMACLSGVAYCAYADDDRTKARELFQQILSIDKENAWAKRGLRNLDEARTRRVWVDSFDRPKGELLNGWRVEVPYGVQASLDGAQLRFSGTQANEGGGKTRVLRTVQSERVVKFEVRLTMGKESEGRAGIRLETQAARAVLFVDPADGHVKGSSARGKGGFSDPVDLGPWPGAGSHALAIDVEDPKKGIVAFFVDGERLGEVKLPGILSGKRSTELVIYVQAENVTEKVEVEVSQAKVYVLREGSSGSGSRGGGY